MTNTLYLPRRYRRPLLLPRGLVALGFLLLIGCRVLVNQPSLHRYSVMHLTMPVVRNTQYSCAAFLPSAKEIRQMCFWQTHDFSGRTITDSLVTRRIRRHLQAMAHKQTFDGLAVRFHGNARYGSLIDALDEVNQNNLPKYFLNIHSSVTTLYVLPLRTRDSPTVSEDADTPRVEVPPTSSGVGHWLDRMSSHLTTPAWGTGLLVAASGWLLAALAWWFYDE